jgi:uncharacterized protein
LYHWILPGEEPSMYLAEIWRYPIKSMAGEMLPEAVLGPMGIPGDREFYVVDGQGQVLTARDHPGLLLLRAEGVGQGQSTVDGMAWDDSGVARRVRDAAGDAARLVRSRGGERFDILPLSVATDGAVAALGVDRRRLRPNLLIGGVEGLAERAWENRFLHIGEAVIGVASLRQRCVMTTWDPDTGRQDMAILRRIHRQFGGTMALDAWAVAGGRVKVGDPVELTDGIESGPPSVRGRFIGKDR